MNVTLGTLGSLRCRILQQGTGAPRLAVVLCHGYGAGGDDLVPLAAEVASAIPEIAADIRFVFPEAPLSLGERGFSSGRAWWELDVEALIERQRGGTRAVEALRDSVPEGLPAARKQLLGLLDALTQQTRLPYSRIVLGGFSQGAMIATDVALRMEEAPAALALLSGTLINASEWTRRASARAGLRVLQSHGTRDPILPFANAVALRDLLTTAGLAVEFIPFDGEHQIPLDALAGLAKLIAAAAGRPQGSKSNS